MKGALNNEDAVVQETSADDDIWSDEGDEGWDIKHDWERGFEMGAELASDELCLTGEDD